MTYYAVKSGKKTGIFNSWDEVKELVTGFEGAQFKSFSSQKDAKLYLAGMERSYQFDKPTAYVDGSFDEATNRYSFGCVLFINDREFHFKRAFKEDDLTSMRNVAGEIKGAGFIIMYCINRGIKELVLYHDYIGISAWYNNEWKANMPGTKKYQDFANQVREKISVEFVKVKSHTNDKYNDLADYLAKEALNLN